MNEARALTMLCIHFTKEKQSFAQFRTRALGMSQYKKSYARRPKNLCRVHKSGHSGGPTILNGENREFLSVSRLGASHLLTRGVITLAQFPFQLSTMSGCRMMS